MTATMPHDDDDDPSVVVTVPPLPPISAADAAAQPASSSSDRVPRRVTKAPRKPAGAVPPPTDAVPPMPPLPQTVSLPTPDAAPPVPPAPRPPKPAATPDLTSSSKPTEGAGAARPPEPDAVPPASEGAPPKPEVPAAVAAAQFAPVADRAVVVSTPVTPDGADEAAPSDSSAGIEAPAPTTAPRAARTRTWIRKLVPSRPTEPGSDAVTSVPAESESEVSLEAREDTATPLAAEEEPGRTDPVPPESGTGEPAQPEPTTAELEAPAPTAFELAVPEPAVPQPVGPEPVVPEAAAPEPVTTEPAAPRTVAPGAVVGATHAVVDGEPAASESAIALLDVVDTSTPDDDALDAAAATAFAALGEQEQRLGGDAAALRLSGVAKSFGATRAVDGLDLVIQPGTFYGIVGPNGAGKTTTLSMIAGLLRPDAGRIEIAGVDLAEEPARAKALMGVLPDRLRTFDRLTGRQLLHYYGVLRGVRPAVVEGRVRDLARAFDLTDALARPVSDYSAGMTKKLMLAGAMIHAPRLLVLDEPFESVDPVSSAVILDILGAYVAHGGTVVLSSHGMELVERICSGVAVIVAGRILAEGTVQEVRGERTLEQRFIELAGGVSDVEGLEWLHTFSG